MKNNIKISISNPCSENWNEMQPNNRGRFCGVCQKTVTDFTQMDDEAFIAYFQNIQKASCGRFAKRQLTLEIPNKSVPLLPFWKMSKYVAASMIAAAGVSGKVFGQDYTTVQNSIQTDATTKTDDNLIAQDNPIIIRGKVLDENGETLPGASIIFKDLKTGTNSDIDGNFVLSIPQAMIKNGFCDIKVISVGYSEFSKSINIRQDTNMSITLRLSPDILGGFEVTIKATKWHRFKKWFKTHFH
jgi:hypothetical protein